MSKVLAATCDALGVVKVEGFPIPDVIILSEGKAASTGLLLIEGGSAWYFPSNAADIASTIDETIAVIDQVAEAITQIGVTLTAIGANMTGATTAPPPSLPADVIALNTKVTALGVIKTELTELKGGLK